MDGNRYAEALRDMRPRRVPARPVRARPAPSRLPTVIPEQVRCRHVCPYTFLRCTRISQHAGVHGVDGTDAGERAAAHERREDAQMEPML
jgi:hypothetical protein